MKLLLLNFIALCLLGGGCKSQKKLLNGYRWKETAPNESIIINPKGKTIIGPGLIELWGKYPYIYGHDGIGKYFILNMNEHKLLFFESSHDFKIALKKNSLPDSFPQLSSTKNPRVSLLDLTDSYRDITRSERFDEELNKKQEIR